MGNSEVLAGDGAGDEAGAAEWLLTPAAIRAQANSLYNCGLQGRLAHFTVDPDRLEAAADYVTAVIRDNYPTLDVPFHARWRHFVFDGTDRYQALASGLADSPLDRLRLRFDLAITSVLLDAGAGADWSYRDGQTGAIYRRSEGLALASLDLFAAGGFSSDPDDPLRADAAGLTGFDAAAMATGFQLGPDNPLNGVDGRVALLNALGRAVLDNPAAFGGIDRPGGLADDLIARAADGRLPAADILGAVLRGLGPIWPGRMTLGGLNLGDTWRHPQAGMDGPAPGVVPFHKLSQWLSYSLIEPLQEFGLTVTGIDALTGLAEYRNGGLFIDLGVITPRKAVSPDHPVDVGDPMIVEWRALTVALLDRIADPVRRRLGKTADAMPLAAILEGGTWSAGRRIAAERRAGGGPPIAIRSDGSVF